MKNEMTLTPTLVYSEVNGNEKVGKPLLVFFSSINPSVVLPFSVVRSSSVFNSTERMLIPLLESAQNGERMKDGIKPIFQTSKKAPLS